MVYLTSRSYHACKLNALSLLLVFSVGAGLTILLLWAVSNNNSPLTTNKGEAMADNTLDHPAVLRVLFHPRRELGFGASSTSVQPVSVEIEPGISVGGRLYAVGDSAPAILYFHGNGEIAADYDDIAPMYTQMGITLLVIDYRGYGCSDGTPTGSNLLTDATAIFEASEGILAEYGLSPAQVYVMGRSLGSASAIEVASHAGNRLAGLIVESGFADTFALVARLGGPAIQVDDAEQGFGNASKISQITIPTLIIHGKADYLIPASEGETLYHRSAAADKRLVLIPGVGHNDLMWVGMEQYFGAIGQFINEEPKQ
jgi:alpha-beta hydrolase superfamily lysophospholipase